MIQTPDPSRRAIVVGGGPAGLMAAEVLAAGGASVDVYDAMPSVGRKFLLAGKGGMNITHSEPLDAFAGRYGSRRADVAPWLDGFAPDAVRAWIHDLGVDTFVGTSGRVFPTDMKAAPLLRAWLHRLREGGVRFHMRHRWLGWDGSPAAGALRFATPEGERVERADAVVLALGGASWARLGSDGAWVPLLRQAGVDVAPLVPANCGFDADWSAHFAERHAGAPLTTVALALDDVDGVPLARKGQFVVTATGIEGSLVYALSAPIRERIARDGQATVFVDLLPDHDAARVLDEVARPRGTRSMSSHLQSRLGIKGVKSGLLHECLSKEAYADPARLARAIKALPLVVKRPRPIDEAISSAGGVRFADLDAGGMLRAVPGTFAAGEMVDWEAPTGGYLLTACFGSGRAAGRGALAWLERTRP
ncbi:TIGR03862 family flavoprotein [Massilia sp. YIM B02763]|uniref:TIGR03862 family flavoprotein n=1 Tax=Massilia sp. YIM B02763 TaxID=3050130 RepID=UPI0025B70369|nr:TIGR03862 family flavoprotein [Massilia sp. YIM B02763]MDN4054912.1 TIGR03862 family flavoprotein [Massilia sp. YIM B02763]